MLQHLAGGGVDLMTGRACTGPSCGLRGPVRRRDVVRGAAARPLSLLPQWDQEKTFTIAEQKAGRSSGSRLVTSVPSVTTSWSIGLPPALRMSVRRLG